MTPIKNASACPSCAQPLPAAASFCPECGSRLASGETVELPQPLPAPPEGPVTVHEAHRRPFGLAPVALLAAALAAEAVTAIALFAVGSWIGGLVFLGLLAASVPLLHQAARREPESQVSAATLSTGARAGTTASLAWTTLRAWLTASVELARLAARRRRLRLALRRQLGPLGQAVHQEDGARAERMKAQAERLERELRETAAQRAATLNAARAEVERQRARRPRRGSHPREGSSPAFPRTNSSRRSSSST